MSNDWAHDERVARAGAHSAAQGLSKNANPYRGKDSEDEFRWDKGYEAAEAEKVARDAGLPSKQPPYLE
jgi:hypothetical protein